MAADPRERATSNRSDTRTTGISRGNITIDTDLKKQMLIQHTSIWLGGTIIHVLTFVGGSCCDWWFYKEMSSNNWSRVFFWVSVLLRFLSASLSVIQWSSFFSYSLASRGIFPFWMVRIENGTRGQWGDEHMSIVPSEERLYRKKDTSRIGEPSLLLRLMSRLVPYLDSTFMKIAPSVARGLGVELQGNRFYDTCKMHNPENPDSMVYVTHHFFRGNVDYFTRVNLPIATKQMLATEWFSEKIYQKIILWAALPPILRYIMPLIAMQFFEELQARWHNRTIIEALTIVCGLIFLLYSKNPLKQSRSLNSAPLRQAPLRQAPLQQAPLRQAS